MLARILVSTIAALLLGSSPAAADSPASSSARERVAVNDNRQPAGRWQDDTLRLELRAGLGRWHPEGDAGPGLVVEAFGEAHRPLHVPAPLIRVVEGASIIARVRNDLDAVLRVHGLCTRNGGECPALDIPAGATREVRFAAGVAGTYHYWATTTGMPLGFRGAADTQLSGAFIVDPAGAPPADDRVFVITEWTSLTRDELHRVAAAEDPTATFLALEPRFTLLLNGRAWPATERLTYARGERVRWRLVNLSTQPHPMHLHGFYFTVESLGDGFRDEVFGGDRAPRVVTQLLAPGATLAMAWVPERAGNWLFHCHVSAHIAPARRLTPAATAGASHHAADEGSAGMAGMVLGVTIREGEEAPATDGTAPDWTGAAPPRRLTLDMREIPGHFGAEPGYGFVLSEAGTTTSAVQAPGPTLVLRRGQPVEIALVNRLPEATAIHWHGMELESYYDGVHGWGGDARRATPLIEPGATFLVRFTPPRTGTFIYHTHLHDDRQLGSGLYGALVVVADGDALDATSDHVLVIGRGGPGPTAPVVVNGAREPRFTWRAGTRHRLRLINITSDDIVQVTLASREGPVRWRALTKDGAPVAADRGAPQPAAQTIAVGETFDFDYEAPPGRSGLWLEVRSPGGRWHVQGRVTVK